MSRNVFTVGLAWAIVFTSSFVAVPNAVAQSEPLFSEPAKEFGVVPRGPLLKHYFILKNSTNQTLQIGNVRVSCGCTSASATRNVVAPGETSAIYATMDTRRFIGDKVVTIYVQLVSSVVQEVSLQVKAHSRNDFQITPETLDFGKVTHGQPAEGKATISFYGNPGWEISGASCKSSFLTPSVAKVKANEFETNYVLTADLRADVPVGRWFTDIWLSTSQPGMGQIRVPVSVEVSPTPPGVEE